jgi:hypothetical protein
MDSRGVKMGALAPPLPGFDAGSGEALINARHLCACSQYAGTTYPVLGKSILKLNGIRPAESTPISGRSFHPRGAQFTPLI